MFDLRPNDSEIIKPSLQTFHRMETKKLKVLLIKALSEQIKELESSTHKAYD